MDEEGNLNRETEHTQQKISSLETEFTQHKKLPSLPSGNIRASNQHHQSPHTSGGETLPHPASDNDTINVKDIQALLCGTLTQYTIQYGTHYQSKLAAKMVEKTRKIAAHQKLKAKEGCAHTLVPDFADHLQTLYDIMGEYLWLHAMNNFRVNIRPSIVGLRLDDEALEKATQFINKTEISSEGLDYSLVSYGDPGTGISTPVRDHHDIFEEVEGFSD